MFTNIHTSGASAGVGGMKQDKWRQVGLGLEMIPRSCGRAQLVDQPLLMKPSF